MCNASYGMNLLSDWAACFDTKEQIENMKEPDNQKKNSGKWSIFHHQKAETHCEWNDTDNTDFGFFCHAFALNKAF